MRFIITSRCLGSVCHIPGQARTSQRATITTLRHYRSPSVSSPSLPAAGPSSRICQATERFLNQSHLKYEDCAAQHPHRAPRTTRGTAHSVSKQSTADASSLHVPAAAHAPWCGFPNSASVQPHIGPRPSPLTQTMEYLDSQFLTERQSRGAGPSRPDTSALLHDCAYHERRLGESSPPRLHQIRAHRCRFPASSPRTSERTPTMAECTE